MFGYVLSGFCNITVHDCSFSDAVPKQEYCSLTLTETSYIKLVYAISNHYWYQMYIGMLVLVCTAGNADTESFGIVLHLFLFILSSC